jgi:hypothetical protein
MSGYAIRQVVLDHLAGKADLSAVVETDSAFDYAELPELAPTLRANDLHAIASELEYILEHLPPDEIAWRRVFLVRGDDGGLALATEPVSDPERRCVRCVNEGEGEGVVVKRRRGDTKTTQWKTYLNREEEDSGEMFGDE